VVVDSLPETSLQAGGAMVARTGKPGMTYVDLMPETSGASFVRVVKRKWDQTIAAVDTAYRVSVPDDTSVWLVPTGSRRERPRRNTIEVVEDAELWVAVPGEWWVLCCFPEAPRTLNGYKVHASAPFEQPSADEITWVDLDLDFEITGDELALLDEEEFHAHAGSMAYPNHIVRGAWSGIATIAARYTNRDWPFNGSLEAWVQGK